MKCISVILLCAAGLYAQKFVTGQAARAVIGQSTFTSQDTNSSDTIVGAVGGLAYAADTLFVLDSNRVGAFPSNHRLLIFGNLSSQLPAPNADLPYNRKCPVCLGQATTVLGQPDFVTSTLTLTATQANLRTPTAVASDGIHLVVADTDHNRVLIWNRIPTTNDAPADVVVGQKDFVSTGIPGNLPNAGAMRGPQGVWIQNGKLFVADTQYNRVLIWNHIPTTNGVNADVVLGAPNFSTFVNPDITQQKTSASAADLLNPVSVSSDGVHLFVTDLGYNRVLIWNNIPTSNGASADVVLGQPDMISSIPNNAFSGVASTVTTDTTDKEVPVLCNLPTGTDVNNNPIYPNACNATMNFPRFALAGNGRLFVADGGNDRVLVWDKIPTTNGALADSVLGQIAGGVNQASDAADSLRTPQSLAWDGTNLYVADPYNRRVEVFTVGTNGLAYQAVRNSASLDITAHGSITIGGTIQAGDYITLTINTATYKYTVKTGDILDDVVKGLYAVIIAANNGAGDADVFATYDLTTESILFTAKVAGDLGNNVNYSVNVTPPSGATTAQLTAVAAQSSLTGGGDAAKIAPGTIVSVVGSGLSANTVAADLSQDPLPTTLGNTQVYFNGIKAPLLYVSPTQINAQIPWEVQDTSSINAYVRSVMNDGSIMVTTAFAVSIVPADPGLFTVPGSENTATGTPGALVAYHWSSYATAVVSFDGAVTAGNVATVTVNGRTYSYSAQSTDTLDSIRDAMTVLLNNDPQVSATAAGEFDRVILKARVQGPEGSGIPITASASAGPSNSSLSLTVSAFDAQTCCGSIGGAAVTQTNPAQPGEIIVAYGTGLGLPKLTDAVSPYIQTGVKYPIGGPITSPQEFVSSFIGGSTADVLQATLLPGSVGIFQLMLHINSGLPSNAFSVTDIAQDSFVSNRTTVPIVNLNNFANSSPVLNIVKTHSGNFSKGQNGATYTVTVTNNGVNPTKGTVTVTETIPGGLTLVSMAGDGWTCSGINCKRADALSSGASYPVITVTVNVASNAASSVTNTVRVTGGTASASTASDVTTIN